MTEGSLREAKEQLEAVKAQMEVCMNMYHTYQQEMWQFIIYGFWRLLWAYFIIVEVTDNRGIKKNLAALIWYGCVWGWLLVGLLSVFEVTDGGINKVLAALTRLWGGVVGFLSWKSQIEV